MFVARNCDQVGDGDRVIAVILHFLHEPLCPEQNGASAFRPEMLVELQTCQIDLETFRESFKEFRRIITSHAQVFFQAG